MGRNKKILLVQETLLVARRLKKQKIQKLQKQLKQLKQENLASNFEFYRKFLIFNSKIIIYE